MARQTRVYSRRSLHAAGAVRGGGLTHSAVAPEAWAAYRYNIGSTHSSNLTHYCWHRSTPESEEAAGVRHHHHRCTTSPALQHAYRPA